MAAVCRMAPQAALLEQSLAVGHRHLQVVQHGLVGLGHRTSQRRRYLERSVRHAPGDGVLTYPVETPSPFSRPFCLRRLQLFDCLVMTLALFVEVRASQHG